VVSGGWRWQGGGLYLPVGHLHTPNDDDSIIVIVFAILYSGDVWGWRTVVLGVVRGEWRMENGDGGVAVLPACRAFVCPKR
jgi:hypothetical protein